MELKKHAGSCHCGKVKFEAQLPKLEKAMGCNCSICSRRGHLLTFIPESQFTLLSGREALTDYQFGKKKLHHEFCSTCGVGTFARGKGPDGKAMVAVNVRCLEGVEIGELKVEMFDGRAL